jgi:hypothetical protein
MSQHEPKHSHPYFRAAENKLPRHRRGRHERVLFAEPKRVDAWLAS